MIVCVHGDPLASIEFCRRYNMKVLESYEGDLLDYSGSCPVIVTGERMDRARYDSLKCDLYGRGVDLVSIYWLDDDTVVRLIRKSLTDRSKRGGRQRFGFYKKNGVIEENPAMMAVARRVIALRDAGLTYREIAEDPEVRHHGGKKLAVSTIQKIVSNRKEYEE